MAHLMLVARQTSGFESGISHNDPGARQDHRVILEKSQGRGGEPPPEAKQIYYKKIFSPEGHILKILKTSGL